jgi:predicted naringenin-chalcone synthase
MAPVFVTITVAVALCPVTTSDGTTSNDLILKSAFPDGKPLAAVWGIKEEEETGFVTAGAQAVIIKAITTTKAPDTITDFAFIAAVLPLVTQVAKFINILA